MATKRVSVRLVAEGGQLVQQMFEGVGESGSRNMRRVADSAEQAQARIDRFSRRARIALAAIVTGAAAAGAAMVRSSMQTIDAQAKLARAVGGSVAAVQTLERAGDRAGVAQSELAAAATRLNQALGQVIATGRGADGTFAALGLSAHELAAMDVDERFMALSRAMRDAGMGSQEMSYHLRALGIRQTSVITLLQSGAEEIERSREAIHALGVAVSDVDAAQIERTNDALSEIGRVWEGLGNQLAVRIAPTLERLAEAFVAGAREGGVLNVALAGLVDNLGLIVSTASVAVGLMAGRWAVASVLLAGRTVALAGALGLVRTAIIRTGIGALIVGLGYLAERFTALVARTGGFGNALELLGDLAKQVWEGMKTQAGALVPALSAVWQDIAADFGGAIRGMQLGWYRFMVGLSQNARQAGWDELAARIGNAAERAGETLDETILDIERRRTLAANLRQEAARSFEDGAERVRAAAQALRDALAQDPESSTDDALRRSRQAAADLEAALAAAGQAGRGAGRAAAQGAEEAAAGWARARQSLAEYATAAVDVGGQVGDAMLSGFRSAESALRTFVETGKADFGSLVRSILADLAILVARRNILGPLANALNVALGGAAAPGVGPVRLFHSGGRVGDPGPMRDVSPLAFVGAQRMHSGGLAGMGLRPDEVPAILQRGERVLSRAQVAAGGGGQTVDVRVYVDQDGRWRAQVERIADSRIRAARPDIVRDSVGTVRELASESRAFLGV